MKRPAMKRPAVRRVAAALAAAVLVPLLSGCQVGGGPGTVTATAVFSDVGGLVAGAPVQMADVPVGQVSSITLDGSRALVTMVLNRSAAVPANVTAKLERTTILGQRFIELAPPARPAGPIVAGARITRTSVVPTVEQLVQAGAQVFGSISTTQMAQIVAAGGQGFGGEEASLRQFLNDLSSVTSGYASRTGQITTVVNGLDQLSSSLAPSAGADAQALGTLSSTTAVLAQQSGRFERLLTALNRVSTQGASLLSTYYPQIVDQLQALNAVSGQLAANQKSLAGLLQYLPVHNKVLASAARNDYLQVFENIIVCGIPGGGSNATPAFTCTPTGSGG